MSRKSKNTSNLPQKPVDDPKRETKQMNSPDFPDVTLPQPESDDPQKELPRPKSFARSLRADRSPRREENISSTA